MTISKFKKACKNTNEIEEMRFMVTHTGPRSLNT